MGISGRRDERPDDEAIRRLVTHFYGQVREDALLGPVFAHHMTHDWDAHLDRMCDFWSGILRASGRYRGNPVQAHAAVPDIGPVHFQRWLELFEGSAHETLEEHQARDVLARAERMSVVLQRNRPPAEVTP
jgi:hemoglobin